MWWVPHRISRPKRNGADTNQRAIRLPRARSRFAAKLHPSATYRSTNVTARCPFADALLLRRTAAIPATMRAAAMDRVGGPEVLTLHTRPVPSLNPGEVLIALHTAGVGGWDADMRSCAGNRVGNRRHRFVRRLGI